MESDEKLKPCPFQEVYDYLDAYYKKHATGIKEVITSQWVRGIVDGRTEALNILKEAIAAWNNRADPH